MFLQARELKDCGTDYLPAVTRRLLKWLVKTHLPPGKEPEPTPEARAKAIEAGLIYRGVEVRDDETGEVVGVEVEDPTATRFIRQAEVKDELERIVSRTELSPGERLILMGMRKGREGEELAEWAEAQGKGVSRASVPVLESRVRAKLRAAAKT